MPPDPTDATPSGQGRVMLIAGGSGAIGSEIAAQALQAGWSVVVHGRTDASAAAAVERLAQRGGPERLLALGADLMAPGAAADVVSRAAAWRGRLDAVVDCSISAPTGASSGRITGLLKDTDPELYGAFAAHSLAPLQQLCQAAAPHLASTKGAVVAFTSDAGRFAAPRQSLIAATRAGIIGFCRSLALEWARDGARINCISLSFVDGTPMFERAMDAAGGRAQASRERAGLGLPRPADVAPLALFLCGEGAARITGQVVSINGGLNA